MQPSSVDFRSPGLCSFAVSQCVFDAPCKIVWHVWRCPELKVSALQSEVSNVSFVDYDLDLTEIGGPIAWDGSDVADTGLQWF